MPIKLIGSDGLYVSAINGGQLAGMRNAIINGNFAINQRGVSGAVTLAAGQYGHDLFKAGASGYSYTFQTVENITTLNGTAGSLMQVIEGVNLRSGQYILSWKGTAQGRVGTGAYGPSGQVVNVVGGQNLTVEFSSGTLSLVQFEPGIVVTPFEFQPGSVDYLLCARYLFGYSKADAQILGVGQAINATNAIIQIQLPARIRATPTVSISGAVAVTASTGGGISVGGITAVQGEPRATSIYMTCGIGSASLVAGNASLLIGGAGAFTFFVSAEL